MQVLTVLMKLRLGCATQECSFHHQTQLHLPADCRPHSSLQQPLCSENLQHRGLCNAELASKLLSSCRQGCLE